MLKFFWPIAHWDFSFEQAFWSFDPLYTHMTAMLSGLKGLID